MPDPHLETAGSVPAPGLYELVLTAGLNAELQKLAASHRAATGPIDRAEAARVLSRHFQAVLEATLERFSSKSHGLAQQVALCNRLILLLGEQLDQLGVHGAPGPHDLITPELLLALIKQSPLAKATTPPRPSFPLGETHLLVNARGEHQIGTQLEREIASADRVDLLCSFLLWSGFSQLKPALQAFRKRPGAKLRVITTVYLGATHERVLRELHDLGAEIRISYDVRRTRLHAKAWLIGRQSGFTTAYIGSSNLSAAALNDGLEWNVRVGTDAPAVLEKFAATFDGYWNDEAFETYHPIRDRDKLMAALSQARGERQFDPTFFDLRPFPFQSAILDRLQVERTVHGRRRNLVVAATGTGKTVVAAFDFRRLREEFLVARGRQPKLLFVAHRSFILEQALKTFRHVLRDASFGEIRDGERKPTSDQAVFATVQSLDRVDLATIPPDIWDIVVFDECHHAAAVSYTKWLEHLKPWVLLGLTATPERFDGQSVLHWFENHVAADLRLWDAIEQGLLAPFRYFALKDVVDLGGYWRRDRGQLDFAALDNVFTGHHARARQVIDAVREHVENPLTMKAIGFCIGQRHARFMAEQFNQAGIMAATVLADDPDRQDRIRRLEQGELQALFTVDVLSEGVDIPNVDTALFLRPTESPTVFLQQLGRGLRLADGKRCLTVLDLVASPDRKFRLDRRYQALLGGIPRREVEAQAEDGFPLLPPGCSIQLTEDAKELVLAALKEAISSRGSELLEELRRLGENASLAQFLQDTGLTLHEFYRKRTLTQLRREAGFRLPAAGPLGEALNKSLPRLLGFDDSEAINELLAGLRRDTPPPPTPRWELVLMTLFGEQAFGRYPEFIAQLWRHADYLRELTELLELLLESGEYLQADLKGLNLPLRLHCHYQRRQIESALVAGLREKWTMGREGIFSVDERQLDVLFVQLRKSEKKFSPSTLYKDYAVSQDHFHWQSQSTTASAHKRGRRHVEHAALGITPLLFVRLEEEDERGETNPYLFLGPVVYVSHEGERPMNILWQLQYPMPAGFFAKARVAI